MAQRQKSVKVDHVNCDPADECDVLQGAHAHGVGGSRGGAFRSLHRLEAHLGLRSLHRWKVQEGRLDEGLSCLSVITLNKDTLLKKSPSQNTAKAVILCNVLLFQIAFSFFIYIYMLKCNLFL